MALYTCCGHALPLNLLMPVDVDYVDFDFAHIYFSYVKSLIGREEEDLNSFFGEPKAKAALFRMMPYTSVFLYQTDFQLSLIFYLDNYYATHQTEDGEMCRMAAENMRTVNSYMIDKVQEIKNDSAELSVVNQCIATLCGKLFEVRSDSVLFREETDQYLMSEQLWMLSEIAKR